MKKNYLLLLFSVLFISSFAQENNNCGSTYIMNQHYIKYPDVKIKQHQKNIALKIKDKEASITKYSNRYHSANSTANIATYTIPVVFHILHTGGPENVSDAQVRSALKVLNNDYAKQNADTAEIISSFKNVADSTHIQFALPTLDPNGNCTNGIMHYYDTDADWNEQSPTLYSYTWDPTKYMNVYIVKTITLGSGFGAAGYAYYPGSWGIGDNHDAIVVLNNYFGTVGTGSNFLSRVLTHEAGHWLSLMHVFGGSNGAGVDCFDDDFVNDTPPTAGYVACPDAADPNQYRLCDGVTDENFQNYMDYSYCVRMFTPGQTARMIDALYDPIAGRDNLWTQSNLIATGVLNPASVCVPVADFKYDRTSVCTNVPVHFYDASTNGHPTIYNWSFPGGTPSTSTDSMPVITYTTTGAKSVTLTTSNITGSSAPITKTNIISVHTDAASYTESWTEDFESQTLPNNDWTISNTSGGPHWSQTFDASHFGAASAFLTAVGNTRKSKTSLISPPIDIGTPVFTTFNFSVSNQQKSINHKDRLQVFISYDCEQTWTEIYNKSGAALSTAGVGDLPFIPANLSEWRNEIIPLFPFISNSSIANFKFTYTRDTVGGTNNIFIDDINFTVGDGIEGKTVSTNNLSIFPNPASQSVNISFETTAIQNTCLKITNVIGQTAETIVNKNLNPGKYTYNINSLNPGVYFVTLTEGNIKLTKKLIVY